MKVSNHRVASESNYVTDREREMMIHNNKLAYLIHEHDNKEVADKHEHRVHAKWYRKAQYVQYQTSTTWGYHWRNIQFI